MGKKWVRPADSIADRVDRIWEWHDEPDLPVLLPGTGYEAFFNLGDPIRIEGPNGTEKLPDAFIISTRNAHFALRPEGKADFISVRFKSGRLTSFCDEPMDKLVDRFVPCFDIWGNIVADLRNSMIEAKGFEDRADLANRFLANLLDSNANKRVNPSWLDYSIDRLYYGFSRCTIEGLSEETGISKRQMERRFIQATGVSPKAFQRTARFQTVLKRLLLARRTEYLETALDSGFYDQAHFIHEFQNFTGETPRDFLRAKNFMSHFYNQHIPK